MDPFETVKQIVCERRSVRKYTSQRIPANELFEVINLAQRAPSSMNVQPYKVLAIHGDNELQKFSKLVSFNKKNVESCSALLVVCADLRKIFLDISSRSSR